MECAPSLQCLQKEQKEAHNTKFLLPSRWSKSRLPPSAGRPGLLASGLASQVKVNSSPHCQPGWPRAANCQPGGPRAANAGHWLSSLTAGDSDSEPGRSRGGSVTVTPAEPPSQAQCLGSSHKSGSVSWLPQPRRPSRRACLPAASHAAGPGPRRLRVPRPVRPQVLLRQSGTAARMITYSQSVAFSNSKCQANLAKGQTKGAELFSFQVFGH